MIGLKVAVLGCGSIGRRHLRNLAALGVEEVVAFDPSAQARQAAVADAPAVRAVDDLEEVWRSTPDAVLVATPPASHVLLARTAIREGCHVLIEKPLSHSLEDVDKLLAEAMDAGVTHMVACNMRFHPGPRWIKAALSAGVIGEVLHARIKTGSYLPTWRPHQDHRASYSASVEHGGAILDCIHEIDLALWYLGPARLRASAVRQATSIGLSTDGLADLLLVHAGGALSNVHLNFVQRDYQRTCELVGSEGTLRWDFHRGAERYDASGVLVEHVPTPPTWSVNEMYVDELRHFLDAASARTPTTNPIEGGVAALRLALEARKGGGVA